MAKKVLMFGWELPPQNSGGLGVACLGLAKSLTKKGIEVTFVLPRKNKENGFFRVIPANISYKYKAIEIDSPLSPYLTPEKYRNEFLEIEKGEDIYGKTLFEEVRRYSQCAKKIAKVENFDIIHAHDWLSFGAGIAAKEVSGKPLVSHVHATEFDRSGEGRINESVYQKEREGMKKADRVVSVSNFTKNIINRHYGIPERNIEVVHNGMDDSEWKIFQKKELLKAFKSYGYNVIVFTGRITIQKGPDYFLKMARKVLDYNKKVIFVISGSGDMERQILRQAAALGISDKVLFTGFIRGEKLYNLYREADIFVMPSVSEPFGLTPLESLTNGTPVLVSHQSGVSEVLRHALKVDFWDTDEMASKILTALNNKCILNCLTENGKKEMKNITWDSAAEKCVNVYKLLLRS